MSCHGARAGATEPGPGTMTEHAPGGGNVSPCVTRVGDTVRKPAGFWTPAVEALLAHLAAGSSGRRDR